MDIIKKYYPFLTVSQANQFSSLFELYSEWNKKINVISRKDISNLYTHHVLHSLSISEVIKFADDTKIIDIGCGGGFPSIPLAIMFPRADFHLVDSVGKKLKVCDAVSQSIGLSNIHTTHSRVEELKDYKCDFVISRAAMSMSELVKCSKPLVKKAGFNTLPNGIITLKGGDLQIEISSISNPIKTWDISLFYSEEYFDGKKIIYIKI